MATSRQIRAEQAGPITLDLSMTAGRINVTVDPDCAIAVLVLATDDDEGPSADAVTKTSVDQPGDSIVVRVPDVPSSGGVTIGRGGRTTQVNFGCGTFIGGDNVTINGVRVSGGVVGFGASEVVAAARVPAGSTLRVKTQSADVVASGAELLLADVHTMSGDVNVSAVRSLTAHTMSGDVEVRHLSETASVNTMSGDIEITATAASTVNATSMSGDIRTEGPIRFSGQSMSGRVRNR